MTVRREVAIVNRLGLHARAATRLVKCAAGYGAEIWLHHGDRRVNGKSIMGVLTLAASQGSTLTLEAEGRDAEAAVDGLAALIADRFGEPD